MIFKDQKPPYNVIVELKVDHKFIPATLISDDWAHADYWFPVNGKSGFVAQDSDCWRYM